MDAEKELTQLRQDRTDLLSAIENMVDHAGRLQHREFHRQRILELGNGVIADFMVRDGG